MIVVKDKQDCCGCTACVERCPRHCIRMKVDEEGFKYPIVDEDKCIHCNLCNSVCPIINQKEPKLPEEVYAARINDTSVVLNSSSGGIFTALSEAVILKGGVVFGARFDKEWNVIHAFTETNEGIKDFQGSKYVQSNIGDSYIKVEHFLKEGRRVLFSGTPCQISGLKSFLHKEYDNLVTVSIICHGVPSPGVWNVYKEQIPKTLVGKIRRIRYGQPSITSINFRDKTNGWRNYNFSVSGEDKKGSCSLKEYHQKNLYLKGYLHNLFLRPSCYNCPARKGKSGADIQLGDYWGVQRRNPEFYDSIGVSLVLLYSESGRSLFNDINAIKTAISYDDVLDCNINVEIDEKEPLERDEFIRAFNKRGLKAITQYCNKIDKYNFLGLLKKVFVRINRIIRK